MGNWHCVSSNCATVHYQEYQAKKIRWRYGSEPWQEIDGDDYSVKQQLGQCNTRYIIKGKNAVNGVSYCGTSSQTNPTPVNSWTLEIPNKFKGIKKIFYQTRTRYQTKADGTCNSRVQVGTIGYYYSYIDYEGLTNPYQGGSGLIYLYENHLAAETTVIDSIVRKDGLPDNCGNFDFKITKNGLVVYTESRSIAPEVQKIPCSLSTTQKQIEIEKLPFLSVIEVIPYGRSSQKLPSIPYPTPTVFPIPNECLNIYKNDLLDFLPKSTNGTNDPVFGDYVAQICSAPGCPPPEYQVICDCNNCESCPDGTCAVECDGQVCCYGVTGFLFMRSL